MVVAVAVEIVDPLLLKPLVLLVDLVVEVMLDLEVIRELRVQDLVCHLYTSAAADDLL